MGNNILKVELLLPEGKPVVVNGLEVKYLSCHHMTINLDTIGSTKTEIMTKVEGFVREKGGFVKVLA